MSRLPRFTLPGRPQHVVQRGNNRAPMFAADADYAYFRECLARSCARYGCQLHAYALMTNHVHLLLTAASDRGIGRAMQSLGTRYVRYFNHVYARTGTLFEGRYRATVVDTERYLFTCCRYIELNPVRAGLVAAPEAYPWSSHRANAYGQPDPLVTPHARYDALGADASSRQAAYRALCGALLPERALRHVRDATHKGWALGDTRFHDEIAVLQARRSRPLPSGRPRVGDATPTPIRDNRL